MNTVAEPLDLFTAGLQRAALPLRGADLPLLVSLDVLLEECNVTRAATRLHVSQPALSAQLSRLRVLFDDPLLVPSENSRGLVPSQFALDLHRRLKPALAALSSAIRPDADSFRPSDSTRTFTVAAANAAAAMVMPALIARLRATGNRALKLITAEPDYLRVAGQLERGEVDVCISPACLLPSNLRVHPLLSTEHVLVQRRGHPRGTAAVGLTEYCQQLDHVTISRDGQLHGYIDEQLYRQGGSRQVAVAVRDFSYVAQVLMFSDLVCTMPAQLARSLHAAVECVPLLFPLSAYSLCLAWHARSDDDAGLQWLRQEVQALFAGAR
ncbi:LysR family transcriptional regulator [Duganella callida]|uniref:LysR family transcriptional regulator n=1 Tax=Duganella callida TaxID=2561932 RepID=A0A4Y9STQ6_9BURK|nr:LysR family transcriptional regulator [Duganella callida]TFW29991.1 LysR family transcriptional regulator [Duganella callida]